MRKLRLTRKQFDRLVLAYRITVFFLILFILIGYSILMNKLIVFIGIFVPYFFSKGFYKTQFHTSSLKACFILSVLIFSFLITITLPHTYSILCSFIIGSLTAYASCKAGEIQHRLKEKPTLCFNTDTCTKAELIERCNELKLSKENIDLAVALFIDKTKHKVLADQLCVEEKSITTRKKRLKQKLNNM